MITPKFLFKEFLSLLYWSMLAACTVGPGTVVTCARAGAEYGLNLIWALIFASFLAYTLQEGTARLTIISGKSLGQCLRIKYRHGWKIYNTAVICWVVAVSVFFGNILYECNNWAGGMSAIYSLPGAENTTWLRIGCCIGYGVVVYALLYWDKKETLSILLGFVMIGMVILFLVVVIDLGLDVKRFGLGLVPNIPANSSNVVLSLVGTTSIGFNLFLGSAMAEGKTLASAQRGIAFSTFSALEVSVLILIVGDGVTTVDDSFSVENLADLILQTIGKAGLWVFGLGFIAAALSSMLTVPLGAALTAESVFTGTKEELDDERNSEEQEDEPKSLPSSPAKMIPKDAEKAEAEEPKLQTFPHWIYLLIMLVIVVVAVIVISCDLPTVDVIQVAQVFNGCLLPFFSICLLLCLNDPQFMGKRPQRWWCNIFLIVSVTITLFLASNVVMHNVFSGIITREEIKFGIAGAIAFTVMATLMIATSLGKEVAASFSKKSLVDEAVQVEMKTST